MRIRNHRLLLGALSLSLGAAALMSGCSKKGDLRESVMASLAAEETPDVDIHQDIVIDYDEAQYTVEDLIDDYEDEYALNDYIDTYVDEERHIVNLIWLLQNEAEEEDAVRYGNFLIRAFNDACADQDFSIDRSAEDYYGGFYRNYRINLQVLRGKDIMLPENYLVSMIIPEDSQESVVPFSQYNGIAEVMLGDGPEWVPGGDYTGDYTAYVESAQAEYESAEAVRATAEDAADHAPRP